MRLVPSTLWGRMLLVSAAATLAALLVAGLVISGVLGRFVTEGLDRRLDAEVLVLSTLVDRDGRVDRARLTERAAVLEAGPGWQWRIVGPDGAVGSRDFAPLDAGPRPPGPPPPPDAAQPGWRALEGAGGDLHARRVTLATGRGSVTITAAAPRDVVRRPIRGALAPLLGTLAALAGLLGVATLVQLRVGLRPLRALQRDVAAIRGGRRRRVDEDQPTELQPLARELNALAADTEAALATARASAANLAHALKTPVATLAIALRDQPAAAQVDRIDRTIRHHLARARAAAIDRRSATPLGPALADLAATIRQLGGPAAPAITLDVADDLAVAVDAQDLDELLGNVIDNAARHARSRVDIIAEGEGRQVAVRVADDGPGIPAAARAQVAQPGVRLDERGDGHGFGLAIVHELATLYGGTLDLSETAGGGLTVTIRLPSA